MRDIKFRGPVVEFSRANDKIVDRYFGYRWTSTATEAHRTSLLFPYIAKMTRSPVKKQALNETFRGIILAVEQGKTRGGNFNILY